MSTQLRRAGIRTETIVLPQEELGGSSSIVERAVSASRDREAFLEAREGRVLGAGRPLGGRAVSFQAESSIGQRIALLKLKQREIKIRSLLSEMSETGFPAEVQKVFDEWMEFFGQLDPKDPELLQERMLALALLILDVIEPSLEKETAKEKLKQLLNWDIVCHEILRQMLPSKESVEDFLLDCAVGKMQKKLLDAAAGRIERVTAVEERLLQLLKQKAHQDGAAVLNQIKKELIDLYHTREEQKHELRNRIQGELRERINQSSEELRACAERIASLDTTPQFDVEELRRTMEKVEGLS